MRILMLEIGESDRVILQELFGLLSVQTDLQVVELPQRMNSLNIVDSQVLAFSDLEIRIREQTVYKDGILIPMSHYEFFTL